MNKITYLCFVVLFCLSFKLSSQTSEIQRVRVSFIGPMDYTRHLLLAFTPDDAASDGFDYGYDAKVFEYFPDDMNWIIEDGRYVIQGVGAFNNSKYYPLGMYLTNTGEVEIALTGLENFDAPIDVFVYDALLHTFTSINDTNYVKTLNYGDYLNRFYITFTNESQMVNVIAASQSALSIGDHDISKSTLRYINSSKELIIKTNSSINLKEVSLYNVLGKKLIDIQNINSNTIKIPLSNLKTNSSIIASLLTEDGKQLNKHIIAGR